MQVNEHVLGDRNRTDIVEQNVTVTVQGNFVECSTTGILRETNAAGDEQNVSEQGTTFVEQINKLIVVLCMPFPTQRMFKRMFQRMFQRIFMHWMACIIRQ